MKYVLLSLFLVLSHSCLAADVYCTVPNIDGNYFYKNVTVHFNSIATYVITLTDGTTYHVPTSQCVVKGKILN